MPIINIDEISSQIRQKYILKDNTFSYSPKEDLEERIDVEIGDAKQPDIFLPQIKILKWQNECNLSVRLIDSSPGETVVSQKGNKIEWIKPTIESHFYDHPVSDEHPEGGFEFEIILKEKPSSNKIQFSIQTKGLDFFYQPPLTQEEINEGCIRPENIIGSYAVYHSTKNGDYSSSGGKNYRAGKAFHIYRPKVKDATGKEIWGELNIDVGRELLGITIDQNFLDSAVYPVNIDPTFGYDTIGGSNGGITANYVVGSLFISPAESSNLFPTSLTIYCYVSSGSGSMKGVLVLHGNLNILTNGIGNAIAMDGAPAWKTSSFSICPMLSISTGYLLMFVNNSSGIYGRLYFDTGDADQGHYDFENSYTSPANLEAIDHDTRKYSIYCTYIVATEVNISDGCSFTDSILAVPDTLINISETLSLTDSILVENLVSLSDSIAFTDVLSFRKSLLTYLIQSKIITTISLDSKIG